MSMQLLLKTYYYHVKNVYNCKHAIDNSRCNHTPIYLLRMFISTDAIFDALQTHFYYVHYNRI